MARVIVELYMTDLATEIEAVQTTVDTIQTNVATVDTVVDGIAIDQGTKELQKKNKKLLEGILKQLEKINS